MSESNYDLIVYGATSFVGQLLAAHLLRRHGVDGEVNWAIAGRSQAKLDQLKQDLQAPQLPTLVADAGDRAALDALVAQTKVVVSTVGPYALFGSELVAACAVSGTHYCDLTGEAQWIRRMVDANEAAAVESGARILNSCGFDSIPSDMGVWFTQQQALKEFGEPCTQIRLLVKKMRGGASGGTIASGLNAFAEQASDPVVAEEMRNPYSIAPAAFREGVTQPDVTTPEYHKDAASWLAPFVMAAINTRIVHRSHALEGHPWGRSFRYDESMMMGDGAAGLLKSVTTCGGTAVGTRAMTITPLRNFVSKKLPQPGEGPSPKQQERGSYDIRFFGETASGKKIQTQVTGDRDPGYGSTSKMLGEVAVALVQDVDKNAGKGGFWTPATAFGDQLIELLTSHAGMTFKQLS